MKSIRKKSPMGADPELHPFFEDEGMEKDLGEVSSRIFYTLLYFVLKLLKETQGVP